MVKQHLKKLSVHLLSNNCTRVYISRCMVGAGNLFLLLIILVILSTLFGNQNVKDSIYYYIMY
jgi:hypothetical protein